jgi:hypothetical protein
MLFKSILVLWVFTVAGSTDSRPATNTLLLPNKIIFYITSLTDRRTFPLDKALIKKLYDLRIEVNDREIINDFQNKLNLKYGLNKTHQNSMTDTRIYIQLFENRKQQTEIEIFAGGQILSINNEFYSTSKEFYDFLSVYIPKGNGENFKSSF